MTVGDKVGTGLVASLVGFGMLTCIWFDTKRFREERRKAAQPADEAVVRELAAAVIIEMEAVNPEAERQNTEFDEGASISKLEPITRPELAETRPETNTRNGPVGERLDGQLPEYYEGYYAPWG